MTRFLTISFLFLSLSAKAQKLDSLFFNLYTDSLKKGTFNYINVDAKYSDGRYLPLTSKELNFTCDAGKFEGNSLFLDSGIHRDSVVVKVALKNDPAISRTKVIYIKKYENTEGLKTMEEVMKPARRTRKG